MNPLRHLNKKQIKKHILFWIIIVLYLNIDSPVPGSWSAKIIGGAIEALNYMFAFYSISLFIFPISYKKARIYLLFLFIPICYCSYSIVTYFNYLKIIPALGGFSWHQKFPPSSLLIENLFSFFIVSSAAT